MEEKFNILWEKYQNYVWYLLKNIYNTEDREDLSQETWLIIWQKMNAIQEGKEKSFIRSVVYNLIGNYIMKKDKENKLMEKLQLLTNEGYVDDIEYLNIMDILEENLTPKEFKLVMFFIQGIKQSDIAQYLNTSQSKVSMMMSKTIRKARYILSEYRRL